jgi:hypothetical protein
MRFRRTNARLPHGPTARPVVASKGGQDAVFALAFDSDSFLIELEEGGYQFLPRWALRNVGQPRQPLRQLVQLGLGEHVQEDRRHEPTYAAGRSSRCGWGSLGPRTIGAAVAWPCRTADGRRYLLSTPFARQRCRPSRGSRRTKRVTTSLMLVVAFECFAACCAASRTPSSGSPPTSMTVRVRASGRGLESARGRLRVSWQAVAGKLPRR